MNKFPWPVVILLVIVQYYNVNMTDPELGYKRKFSATISLEMENMTVQPLDPVTEQPHLPYMLP